MIVLAFDTSTSLGSVAVGDAKGEVFARRFLRKQGAHASSLVPAIQDVLGEAELDRSDVEGIVVGAGPGSFTGLRVSAATAKGLVRGMGISLTAVSSLASGAVTAGLSIPGLDPPSVELRDTGQPRYVLFDARADRVYGACFRIRNGWLENLVPPHAGTLEDVLRQPPPANSLFCGGGARRHWTRIEAAGFRVLPAPAGIPTADGLLHVLGLNPGVEAMESPGRWEPQYLRAWRPGWERETG